jgi:MFS family permease
VQVTLMGFLGPCVRQQWGLPASAASQLGAAVFGGELLGCLVWGPLADWGGRRGAYLASCLTITAAAAASAAAPNLAALTAARAVVGFGG